MLTLVVINFNFHHFFLWKIFLGFHQLPWILLVYSIWSCCILWVIHAFSQSLWHCFLSCVHHSASLVKQFCLFPVYFCVFFILFFFYWLRVFSHGTKESFQSQQFFKEEDQEYNYWKKKLLNKWAALRFLKSATCTRNCPPQ